MTIRIGGGRFPGGLVLPPNKARSTAGPIRTLPLPPTLVVPLRQHAGEPSRPCVAIGERVLAGQRIAEARGERGVAIHASASGAIVAIEPHATHDGPQPCIVIAVDGDERAAALAPFGVDAPVEALRERLRDCGVAGLGGAAFATAKKLARPVDLLVINGAECEPYIACDDSLLRERADEVVAGAKWMQRIVGATRLVIAVEDSMLEARDALLNALGDEAAMLVEVPTIYPEGGERQLIQVLTGREVPSGGLPQDIGIVVQNVGTAAAVHRAIARGEAMTTRLVSVNGPGVVDAATFEVRFGTSVAQVVAAAGGYTDDAARLVVGGPMMGVALESDAVPVVKATNSILVLDHESLKAPAPELPCIRCGECARACPAMLLPQQLLGAILANDAVQTERLALFDCIECGCCAYVCPSQIPLVDHYRAAKSELRLAADRRVRADRSKRRHAARQDRLDRIERERAARLAARTAAALAPATPEDPVAAALARAAARRAERAGPRGDDGA